MKYSYNVILGGEFGLNPWQRGTVFTSVANGQYTADRFQYNKVGTMVHDIRKDTSAPPTPTEDFFQSTASLLIDCTTAQAIFGAGDYCTTNYKVEGYDLQTVASHDFQIGFWLMSNKTGIHCLSIRNAGLDRSYLIECNIASSMVWQWFQFDVLEIPLGGTWDFTNGIGLNISLCLGSGSTFRDLTNTTGSWLTGNYLCTNNQINSCDSNLNYFWIDNMFLSFYADSRSKYDSSSNYLETLRQCQRYYEKSYNQGVNPGTATTVGINSSIMPVAADTNLIGLERKLIVPKRNTPVITWYSALGTTGNITDSIAGDVVVTGNVNEGEVSTGYPTIGVGTANNVSGHWTADAEL